MGQTMSGEILYKEESYQIMGACFEVYKEKGSGFLEPVYQECLSIEFTLRGVPFLSQPELNSTYKGHPLNQIYKPDFVCYEQIILEIKAVSELTSQHRAQIHDDLRATGFRLGLLVNFTHYPRLQSERIVL